MNAIIEQQKESFDQGYLKGLLHAYSLSQSNQIRELERLINGVRDE